MNAHKEYRIMVRSRKDGKWYHATIGVKKIYTNEAEALAAAEKYIARDAAREFPNWTDYKIMTRSVTEWEDAIAE